MAYHTSFEHIKNGDRTAFERMFREYYEEVHRFIWGYVESQAVAEELTQDVFLKLWDDRETITIKKSLKAYLYQIARNKSIDWLRHKKVERNWEEEKKVSQENIRRVDASKQLHNKDMLREVKQAISNMPRRRRQVFMLSRYDGLTYNEIAETLEISVKTVETHMSRALKVLRDRFLHLLIFLIILLRVH